MQALLKFLIQNHAASLAKLAMGMAVGPLLTQYSLDSVALSAALAKVDAKLGGATPTYASQDEQDLVEGIFEILTPVLTYWKFPLTAVELAPLIRAIATKVAARP